MPHFYAIAEPDGAGGFWLSFPDRDGITSAAQTAAQIVPNARDALESADTYGGHLPRSIEDGASVPTNLAEYDQPLVVVVPFEPAKVSA
jgi:predicted RNase H-like HicB family nuclease